MGYEHKVLEFHGDYINFFVNKTSVLVGAKSLATGMKVSWSPQLAKIKRDSILSAVSSILYMDGISRSITCLKRGGLQTYLNSFNVKRLNGGVQQRVILYQKEFVQFAYDSTECQETIEQENRYLASEEGLKQLIYDSIVTLGNENAVAQLASIIEPLINSEVLSVDDLKVLDPVYDMAEKTADRQGELKKYKKDSIGVQLEGIAERIRDIDRRSCLELRRIAKSVY